MQRLIAALTGGDSVTADQVRDALGRFTGSNAPLIAARACVNGGQLSEAVAILNAAAGNDPDDARLQLEFGKVLCQDRQFEAALKPLARSIELDPGNSAAHHQYGWTLSTLGAKEQAINELHQAVKLDNSNAAAHYQLSTLKRYKPDDPHLHDMRAALNGGLRTPRDRSRVLYAMGRAQEQLGFYEQAYSCYQEAGQIRRRDSVYDLNAAKASIQCTIDAFTPALFAQTVDAGDSSALPIFLIGMPRSGSTLIEQILASHPACEAAGEIVDFSQAHIQIVQPLSGPQQPWPGNVRLLPSDTWQQIGSHYVRNIGLRFPRATRITDKQLLNYSLAGVIHLALPKAAIIHCRRDPLDTCVSCFATAFRNDYFGFTGDLRELGASYRLYAQLMQHWERVLPGRILHIDYEVLVERPEEQIARLLAHVGLPWADECLAFHRTTRPVATSSRGQVTEPLYRSSIGRWRRFESFIGPLRNALDDNIQDTQNSFRMNKE